MPDFQPFFAARHPRTRSWWCPVPNRDAHVLDRHRDMGYHPVMEDLIQKFNLAPHPEGGFFKEMYRSKQSVWSDAASADRAAVTHIYFLLTAGQVSRFHRVVHDEIWHIYQGDPLRLMQFDGLQLNQTLIGSGCTDYTAIVPAGIWQAAATTGSHTLAGCTVAPGFDFTDFCFLADHPADLERFTSLDSGLHAFI
jgi:uncharacterized protein